MGCCLGCPGFWWFGYKRLPEVDKVDKTQKIIQTTTFQAPSVGQLLIQSTNSEFDLNSSPFVGLEIDQKFISKSTYDRRFVWLNLNSRTIHMSEHSSKERRHKEASLADVTSVIAGPPIKAKNRKLDESSENGPANENLCLTLNFQRGGGVDLRFSSERERNLWFDVLNRIVLRRII